jgi:transcriptional regulator GlxA family with amidase domain
MIQQQAFQADRSSGIQAFGQLRAWAGPYNPHVPQDRIALAQLPGDGMVQEQTTTSACPGPLIERLVRALLPREQADQVLQGFYTDILHTTLVKRLAELRDDSTVGPSGRRLTRLQNWRLRRVCEHVENNLGGQLALADLARAAGMSRMHFAAQFRVATGMSPHSYVTHRRILRAKTMLSETTMPIADVALCVGFKTQPHFTTVFRQHVGYTPRHWRMLRGEAALQQAA